MFIYKRCDCQSKATKPEAVKRLASLSEVLKLVSVPSRLNILSLLSSGPHCVCDLESHSKMSQTLVSHHLSDLTKAGLVKSQKTGSLWITA